MSPAGRGFTHPIHVHGYSYRVVAMERVRDSFRPPPSYTPPPISPLVTVSTTDWLSWKRWETYSTATPYTPSPPPHHLTSHHGCHGEGEIFSIPSPHPPSHPPSHFPPRFPLRVVAMVRVRDISLPLSHRPPPSSSNSLPSISLSRSPPPPSPPPSTHSISVSFPVTVSATTWLSWRG